MPLDEWQEVALEAAMGERSNGLWASKFVGISAPRQNGKSQLIVARALAGVLLFGEKKIIISAHETDTAREVWKRLVDVVEENPTLEARVTGRMNAVNREFLAFGTGLDKQEIKLKARSTTGSRGFSADCLLLDEGQILGKRAWGSIVPTMSARPNPQLWLFGTPPTEDDDPFAFSRVRDSSLRKKARHTWLEWAADPSDDFDDPATWAKANPSYGVRITHEACADDRAAMDDEQFALERLGIWLDPNALTEAAFGPGKWEDCAVDRFELPPAAVGLAVSFDRKYGSIGVAAQDGGKTYVGSFRREAGTHWLVAEAKRIVDRYGCGVVIDGGGPASDLEEALAAAGVPVTTARTVDYLDACAQLYDRVQVGEVVHQHDDELDAAVDGAGKRVVSDRWAWSRQKSSVDVSMLEAVTLAAWKAAQAVPTVW